MVLFVLGWTVLNRMSWYVSKNIPDEEIDLPKISRRDVPLPISCLSLAHIVDDTHLVCGFSPPFAKLRLKRWGSFTCVVDWQENGERNVTVTEPLREDRITGHGWDVIGLIRGWKLRLQFPLVLFTEDNSCSSNGNIFQSHGYKNKTITD